MELYYDPVLGENVRVYPRTSYMENWGRDFVYQGHKVRGKWFGPLVYLGKAYRTDTSITFGEWVERREKLERRKRKKIAVAVAVVVAVGVLLWTVLS